MLTKFAVTNYRGFEKRIEFDLEAVKNYEFSTFAVKDNVIKNGIIYGPNGSGKSNFGLAIFDIVYHLTQKMKRSDYYVNFTHLAHQDMPVEFEYYFKFGDIQVLYEYNKDGRGKLIYENLVVNGKTIFTKKSNYVELYDNFPITQAMKEEIETSDNNISMINFIMSSYPLQKEHYLVRLCNFVDNMLFFRNPEGNEFIGFKSKAESTHEYIIKNNLLDDFTDFLKEVSGQSFKFLDANDNLLIDIDGNATLFSVIESTGTKSLTFLYFWYKNISDASFVFVDEFDAFYHFDLAFKVCQRLFKHDCQLFLSSHNTYLMTNDLLRPDCNFILDQNVIKPLYKCTDKELRFGHNMEKLFRGGTFNV
ncbi:MAG: AAA family ATPase [Treponema sp.]